MVDDPARSLKKGLIFGLFAAMLLVMAQMLTAPLVGYPPSGPLRLYASVLFGQQILLEASGAHLLLGLLFHLALSGCYGILYGALNLLLAPETRARLSYQAALGLLWGAAVWLVNFAVLAPWLYPWFLEAAPLVQLALHVLAFGLPLGLMFAAAERHGPFRRAPNHAPS